jgi:tyrosyl-DNA phosphodiesterase 2
MCVLQLKQSFPNYFFHFSGLVASTKPPTTLSMVTWNIDGLDGNNLGARTAHIIKILNKIKPDVIFLQEVTQKILEDLKMNMIDYHIIEQVSDVHYFTCILLHRTNIYMEKALTKRFENSTMGRGLQCIDCHVEKVKISLFNVHLESTGKCSKKRMQQLEECISEIKQLGEDTTVILAGDMNIRDKEVKSLCKGIGLPPSINDIWELLGKRKQVQYTWDMRNNTNLQILGGKMKPQLRFDRVYIKDSQPIRLVPKFFDLIGTENVPGTELFPSDHWGILTSFELKDEQG